MAELSDDERALAGTRRDPERFAVVYRRHSRAVLHYLLRRTGSAELAADLTAEVFAAAFCASSRFKPGMAPVRAWLFTIANSKLVDHYRRGQSESEARRRLGMRPLEFEDDELARVEEEYDSTLGKRGLWTLVDDLPEAQRQAVLARVVDDRPYAELAVQFGVPEATVRQRVRRGLARLAQRTPEEQK